MKTLLLLFLFLCSLEVAQAQPGISTAIPSEKPSKYQKDQIKRKYGMFIHFGINTFHDVEWSDGSFPVETYAPAEIDACQWVKSAKEMCIRDRIKEHGILQKSVKRIISSNKYYPSMRPEV